MTSEEDGPTGDDQDVPVDPSADCTAILVTLPLRTATRVSEFLRAHGVPCRLRQAQGMTPERLMDEIRASNPEATRALQVPVVGGLLRTRLKHGLRVEMQKTGMDVSLYDLLVRPDDLAAASEADAAESGAAEVVTSSTTITASTAEAPDPWARPDEATIDAPALEGAAVLCERPWGPAWSVVDRLTEAGIPASVLPAKGAEGVGVSIEGTIFRVVVQPADLERARAETGHLQPES